MVFIFWDISKIINPSYEKLDSHYFDTQLRYFITAGEGGSNVIFLNIRVENPLQYPKTSIGSTSAQIYSQNT